MQIFLSGAHMMMSQVGRDVEFETHRVVGDRVVSFGLCRFQCLFGMRRSLSHFFARQAAVGFRRSTVVARPRG